MNYLHIISGDLWGGKEAQMLLQLKELKKRQIELTVILFNSKQTYQKYTDAGLNCIVLEEQNGFLNIFKGSKNLVNEQSVIFAHGYKEFFLALSLKVIKKCKILITFHGDLEPQKSFYSNLKSKFIFYTHINLSKIFADRIICVSNALKEKLGFINAVVIKNCVELTDSHLNNKNNIPVIFMAGRIVPIKRYDLAIEAVKNLNVELQIAGDGALREDLEKLASDNVKFLGFRNDIQDLLSRSNILLICSDSEGIPTILLEALSMGLKCIATQVGGIPEVLELFPNNIYKMIKHGDSKNIEKAISEFLVEGITVEDQEIEEIRKIIFTNFSPHRAANELLKLDS